MWGACDALCHWHGRAWHGMVGGVTQVYSHVEATSFTEHVCAHTTSTQACEQPGEVFVPDPVVLHHQAPALNPGW